MYTNRECELLRWFSLDLLEGKKPSDRCLTNYAGRGKMTWDETQWVYKEVGRIIKDKVDC